MLTTSLIDRSTVWGMFRACQPGSSPARPKYAVLPSCCIRSEGTGPTLHHTDDENNHDSELTLPKHREKAPTFDLTRAEHVVAAKFVSYPPSATNTFGSACSSCRVNVDTVGEKELPTVYARSCNPPMPSSRSIQATCFSYSVIHPEESWLRRFHFAARACRLVPGIGTWLSWIRFHRLRTAR